jgi:disulfide bond formation protein DsbB
MSVMLHALVYLCVRIRACMYVRAAIVLAVGVFSHSAIQLCGCGGIVLSLTHSKKWGGGEVASERRVEGSHLEQRHDTLTVLRPPVRVEAVLLWSCWLCPLTNVKAKLCGEHSHSRALARTDGACEKEDPRGGYTPTT